MKIDTIFFLICISPSRKHTKTLERMKMMYNPVLQWRGRVGGAGPFTLKRLDKEVETLHNNIMSCFLIFFLLTPYLTPHLVD